MKEYAIKASHVSKKFDNVKILNDLNFEVVQNTKLAILGHNGSGKSSLLKMIAGIYAPSSGEIHTFGKKIGYVPEHFPEHIRFKLEEYLLHIGTIGGEHPKSVQKKIDYYSTLFQLEPHMNTLLKHCSKGTKQKAGLIQAIINDCDILLLDEPLTGLDDDSKKAFLQMIQEKERDLTLIFTAHEQETVDLLAEEQLVLENGKMIKFEAITEKTRMKIITVKMSPKLQVEELKVYGKIESEQRNIIDLLVRERECDDCLLYLLQHDCSIIEVKEKK
ncbi:MULTISPECIES: ATP-binding cassette domain-containing protein [Bacillus]|uniref:ATP-binding cassette domain-containing protein n=1 Tax=Bacillus TaxID=1386 RepID=UPI000317C0EE|nr:MULTISPECIES: ABC transporter ATP-binding protein [Bacillus]